MKDYSQLDIAYFARSVFANFKCIILNFFPQQWKNEFISWNPDSYCGIKEMYIKRDNFWQPDLYIYEM